MLACDQFAAAFFAHRRGARRALGFGSGHLRKKAFEEIKNMLKFCNIQCRNGYLDKHRQEKRQKKQKLEMIRVYECKKR
jgi:hypothetical protein